MLPSYNQLVTSHFQLKLMKNSIAKCLNEKDMVMAKANKNKYQLQAIIKKMFIEYFLIFLFHPTSRLFLFSLSHTDMGQLQLFVFLFIVQQTKNKLSYLREQNANKY